MVKRFCDLCQQEVKHKECYYIDFKDAKGYSIRSFELCHRCFDEISATAYMIPGRDKQCT